MTQPIASSIVNGVEFSVLEIDINRMIPCPGGCPYFEDLSCEHRNKSMRKPKAGSLICTLLRVNIKNLSDTPFDISHENGYPKIIDSKGFSFDAIYFCDAPKELLRKNFIDTNMYQLMPKAQVNTIFAFPELAPNTSLRRFTYSPGQGMWDLVLGESEFEKDIQSEKEEEIKTKGVSDEDLLLGAIFSSGEGGYLDTRNFNNIRHKIKQLKLTIFKRFNNVLDSRQTVYFENAIQNLIFDIDTSIEESSPSIKQKYLPGYSKIKEDLLRDRNKEQKQEKLRNERKIKKDEITVKTKAILDLSPEAFEEYISSLFSCMGYKVELTSRTRDKGVDIFLYKDDKKIAVQCKKYSKKNLIGSPDMQGFLGAIHNSNSVKGIFITSSFFTLEAEKFARNNPIELIDSVKLEKMISEILLQIEKNDSSGE